MSFKKIKKMKLSLKEYNDLEGAVCPFCETTNIHVYSVDYDRQVVYRDHLCKECHNGWTEYFTVAEIEPWQSGHLD